MPQYNVQGTLNTATGLPPHAGMPIHRTGAPLAEATTVVILVHGRGAGASGILPLAGELDDGSIAFLAPDASGGAWYPFSFLSPTEANEPGLSSALSVIGGMIVECERMGITPDRIALVGFSQGACLALEYAIRHPKRYRTVVGFSGGLIGPRGTRWTSASRFADTPVFLGCSDRDMHIPAERVAETARAFESCGATVDMRLYPGMGHTIVDEEIEAVRDLLLTGPDR